MPENKKVMISQSNYIPWKGYFDSIHQVDEFILFDNVQYTRRDWRNRNRIKSPAKLLWLSIPIDVTGKYTQLIQEAQVSDLKWGEKHWRTISQCYSKAPFFDKYAPIFEPLYLHPVSEMLSEINRSFIEAINSILEIHTRIRDAREFPETPERNQRLLNLCIALNATEYWSGPSAKNYLKEDKFLEAGIKVNYFDYSGYPAYPQLHGEFLHEVSVLDLIFNTGPKAPRFMKTFDPTPRTLPE